MSDAAAVAVHPTAVVDPGARLGVDVEIGPYCVVGPQVTLGDRVRLIANVSVVGRTTLGADAVVHPFAALGSPPQDLRYENEDTALIIGRGAVIREHVTMHLGTAAGRGETRVGDNGLFMVGCHVAHDCVVGDGVVFANNATMGGHVVVGDNVYLGGLCAIHQHCRVGRYAFIGGCAPLTGDVIPYGLVDKVGALNGLNLVGLKRRGFERERIHDMRTAYRLLFSSEGAFQERVEDVARLFSGSSEVMEMVEFIRTPSPRHLCTPELR